MQARDLDSLLGVLDPSASLVDRHLALLQLMRWIRGDARSVDVAHERLALMLQRLDNDARLKATVQAWWRTLRDALDTTTLLADHGLGQRPVLIGEFFHRLIKHLLPGTPLTRDGAELCEFVLTDAFDVQWLAQLPASLEQRLADLLSPSTPDRQRWHDALDDALICGVTQLCALGMAPDLRLRMGSNAGGLHAFQGLMQDLVSLRQVLHQQGPQRDAAALQFRERLDECRSAVLAVYGHLDEFGISVDVVFRLRQLRGRALRCRRLLEARLAPQTVGVAGLLAEILQAGHDTRSLRALVASNSSLLAERVAERSAETGEHYITRNRAEYADMVRKAAGGGAVISVTTLVKFALLGLSLSAFWSGLAAGLNYAFSFVLIQLLHWTVATKQPAMTAPALAARLRDLQTEDAVSSFVGEVAHLVRSQVAAILGNLAMVVPGVLLLCAVLALLSGHAPLSDGKADHVLRSLAFLGPSWLYAAGTGILLFASSILAGWVENWFVLHRLESALRYHPRLSDLLGRERAASGSAWLGRNISGLTANISLGLMLGLVPAFAQFFGIGFDVRHVTLAAGQLAAALVTLGPGSLFRPDFWSCVATLFVIGALNVGVSFFLAFRVALRAHNVTDVDRTRIYQSLRKRLRTAPLSFFWPARSEPPESKR